MDSTRIFFKECKKAFGCLTQKKIKALICIMTPSLFMSILNLFWCNIHWGLVFLLPLACVLSVPATFLFLFVMEGLFWIVETLLGED